MRHTDVARHRIGTPCVRVPPRTYDDEQRAAAARLDRREPRWVIWYGPWSRKFYAASAASSAALIVEAAAIDDLVAAMRAAEREAARAAGRPAR